MNLLLPIDNKEKMAVNEHYEETNLKLLDSYGFTYCVSDDYLSVAGIFRLLNFRIYMKPGLLFDSLNALIDYIYDQDFGEKQIDELIDTVHRLYLGSYWKCHCDLVSALRKARSVNHTKLMKIFRRYLAVIQEIRLNGEDSPNLLKPFYF